MGYTRCPVMTWPRPRWNWYPCGVWSVIRPTKSVNMLSLFYMFIYAQDLCRYLWPPPAQLNPLWPHSGHYCYCLLPPELNNNFYNAFAASLAHLSSLWTILRCLAPKTPRSVWRGLDVSSMPHFIPNIHQHLHSSPHLSQYHPSTHSFSSF